MVKKTVFFIIITILFVSGCFFFPKEKIPYTFEVSKTKGVGINADTNALHFGRFPPKGGGKRFFDLENDYEKKCNFVIAADGQAVNWLTFEKNFTLNPFETKHIEIKLFVPENTPNGFYSGNILIYRTCEN